MESYFGIEGESLAGHPVLVHLGRIIGGQTYADLENGCITDRPYSLRDALVLLPPSLFLDLVGDPQQYHPKDTVYIDTKKAKAAYAELHNAIIHPDSLSLKQKFRLDQQLEPSLNLCEQKPESLKDRILKFLKEDDLYILSTLDWISTQIKIAPILNSSKLDECPLKAVKN